MRPPGPVSCIVRTGDVRASLSPVAVLVGKGLVHASHRIRSADIGVPCSSVDALVYSRVAEFVDNASPKIVVVVQNPDLRVERGAFQCRSEVPLDEFNLILLPPQAGGHFPVLIGIDLGLPGDGVDWYAP